MIKQSRPICPACGRVEVLVAKFCGQCGTKLISETTSEESLNEVDPLASDSVRNAVRKIGSQVGREIVRGVLGDILKGKRR